MLKRGRNDLKTLYPAIAEEWDYEKNGNLRPEDVAAHSHDEVNWRCKKGHAYVIAISRRTSKYYPARCPYCTGRLPIKGETDLLSQKPQVAAEWDYEKNGMLRPEDVTLRYYKKAFWKCAKGHGYEARVTDRVKKIAPTGCPYCAGKLPIIGETDLLSQKPLIAAEWDFKKNGTLKPEDVNVHSNKNVYWICDKGHGFKAMINNRTRKIRPTGCPYCAGKLPIIGETDLLSQRPEIAAEWDYEKNGKLRPENICLHSSKKIYWKCEKNHSYRTCVSNRVDGRNNCPYCEGMIPIKGETDLLTIRPDIAMQWDYEGNKGLLPEEYLPCSNKKVSWRCDKNHKYPAQISARTRKKDPTGCPYCNHKKPIVGENDLETKRPDVVMDWDYRKNRVSPSEFLECSNRKVWWKCHICGEERFQRITKRVSGQGCSRCLLEKCG